MTRNSTRTIRAIILATLMATSVVAGVAAFGGTATAQDGTTITVGDGSGDDYPSIQEAINNANSGDTIIVQPGTYDEDVEVTEDVTLDGSERAAELTGRITVSADGATVRGFDVTNPAGHIGIHAEDVTGITIESNLIHDVGTGVTGSSVQAIYLNNAAGSIVDNEITNVANSANAGSNKGIFVGDSNDGVVEGVTITGNTISEIYADDSAYTNGGSGSYGILVNHNVTELVISDNEIRDLSGLWVHAIGLEGPTPDAVIADNRISNLAASKGDTVDLDDFRDEAAIFFEANPDAASVTITNNTFGNLAYGVLPHPDNQGESVGTIVVVDGPIQDAVDTATDGDRIEVRSGTYTEQVYVNKSVTLVGAGEGQTVIESPDSLTRKFTDARGHNYPVVFVENADVDVSSLTVDGASRGDNHHFYGIVYRNASGVVANVTIDNVRDSPMSGVQHGVAVAVINADDEDRTFEIRDSTLVNYQKNGFYATGAGLTVQVIRNDITGAGPTDVIGQNGIQVGGSAIGIIKGNTVSEHSYTPSSADGTGIYLYPFGNDTPETTEVANNTVRGNDNGIAVGSSPSASWAPSPFPSLNVSVTNNEFEGNKRHVYDAAAKSLDATAVYEANTFDAAAYASNESGAVGRSIYGGAQTALNAAAEGDTIHLSSGTFVHDTGQPLRVKRDNVTLSGAGQGATTVDVSASSHWGLYVNATGVTIEGMTVLGPTNGNYGIHVGNGDEYVSITVRDVTVRGSNSIELDLHGVEGGLVENVTVDGTGTSGAGIGLSDSHNVTVRDVTAVNNPWGGIAIMTNGQYNLPASTSNVTVTGDNTFDNPAAPVYVDPMHDGRENVTDLHLAGFDYEVTAGDYRDGDFAWYFRSRENATLFAEGLVTEDDGATPNHPVVQNVRTGEFSVSDATTLRTAVENAEDGDTIELSAGTYNVTQTLTISADNVTIRGDDRDGVVINTSAVTGYGISTTEGENVTGVTVENVTVIGPQQGTNANYAFKFNPTTEDVVLRNVDVEDSHRTGIDFNGVDTVLIEDVTVSGTASGNGIALADTQNVIIDGVTVEDNTWGGIALYTNDDADLEGTHNVTIRDSTIQNNGGPGVYAQNSGGADTPFVNITVAGNEFAGNQVHVAELTTDNGIKENADWFDLGAVLNGNDFDRTTKVDNGGEVWEAAIFGAIQPAVDVADDGDTVYIGNGEFEENVVIDKSITLDGDGTGDTVIAPSNGHPISVENLVDGDRIKIDDVTVTDLTLRAPDGSIGLITVSNNDGDHETGTLTVEDVVVEGGDASFGLFDTERATFENVVVRDVEGDAGAFEVGGVGELTIRNSLVEDSTTGVKINDFTELGYEETGTVTIEDTTFAGNDVHVNVTEGIDASAVTVRFNTFGADGRSAEAAIGVRNAAAGELNATHNYWGSPSGPAAASNTYNVDSQGSAVVGDVDYAPWLDAPIDESPTLDAPVENTRTHEEYTSIQAAVDDAAAGDTLVADAGTYDESVTVATDNLTLVGEDGATVRGTVGFSHLAFTDDVSVQGFTFTGVETAIDANNAGDNLTVVDNEFVDVTNAVIHGGQTGGQDHVKTGWIIAGNDVHDAGSGFRLWNVGDLVVADNEFETLSGSAVSLVSVDGATVTGNAFTDTTKAGVFVEGPFNEENLITSTHGILVVDNTFSNAGANDTEYPQAAVKVGEFLADRDEVTVEENSIVAFRTHGLYVQESAVDATGTVDATHNYWGAPSGPSDEFEGRGAAVSTNVTVEPFYVGQSRQTLSKAVRTSDVDENKTATVELDGDDAKSVRIALPSNANATSVTVTEADAPTGDATDPDRNVATYLDIDAGGDVEGNVTVSVTVQRSTLESAGIAPEDAVILHFTDGNWTELETVATVNGDQVTLEATSNGLSPFAVAQRDVTDDEDDAPGRSGSRRSDRSADAPSNRVSTTLLGGQAHLRVPGHVPEVSVYFADGGTGGSVTVEALDARPDSIPAIPNANGLAYVDVSVPDGFENSEATLEFTVDATAVGDVDASDLVVYHYHGGEWSTLDTSVVSEDGDEVVLEATTPGFSVFAVGSADGSGTATPADEPADDSTDEPADQSTDEPADDSSDGQADEPADQSTDEPVEELGGFNVGLLLGVLLLVAIVGAIAYVRIGRE